MICSCRALCIRVRTVRPAADRQELPHNVPRTKTNMPSAQTCLIDGRGVRVKAARVDLKRYPISY